MTLNNTFSFIACVSDLSLALIVLARGQARGPTVPLALLSVALFMLNFSALANGLSGDDTWRVLYVATVPLLVPLTFHFVLGFLGRARQWRWMLASGYFIFSALSVVSVLSFVANAPMGEPRLWAVVLITTLVPPSAWTGAALVQHLRNSRAAERKRTWVMLGGIAIFVGTGVTEMLGDMGLPVPRLGAVGQAVFTALLVSVAVRLGLFGAKAGSIFLPLAVLGSGLATLYLFFASLWGATPALLLIAALALLLAASGIVYRFTRRRTAEKERLSNLATLGRLSAQMAHDFKNPLSAIKGAVQFLEQERALGRSIDDRVDFLKLLGEQVNRLNGRVDEYQRLGKMELSREQQDVNELVQDVMALQHFASPVAEGVALDMELTKELPPFSVDRDLMCRALQNLLRNAFEAVSSGGAVTVKTFEATHVVCISVSDNGRGMDARTSELAFDEFFTTKPTGTGLGLSFVKRVVEAHGGAIALKSKEDLGTTVTLRIPVG